MYGSTSDHPVLCDEIGRNIEPIMLYFHAKHVVFLAIVLKIENENEVLSLYKWTMVATATT